MSARRKKAWSQHQTPHDQVNQGKSARKAQVEKALANTALFKVAKRLSNAAVLLAGVIPPQDVTVSFGGKTVPWGTADRFPVLRDLADEATARCYLRDQRGHASIGEYMFRQFRTKPKENTTFEEWVGMNETELSKAMAWARENLSPLAMMRLAATWPHNDWLPIDGEIA